MADYSQRTTTERVTRHEWRLSLPSNWVELDKMLVGVKQYAERMGLTRDDSLLVD